jgi:predicted anti-sigma-YlaC factor YlaD
MEHEKIKELISCYLDGELSEEDKKTIENHIRDCRDCQKELEDMARFEEVMGMLKLKKPKKEVWEEYWSSVYNRLERRIGWVFISLGGAILLFFGLYKLVEGMITDASTPLILKLGILIFLAGIAVLFISLLKEQLFVRKKERYKEVEK